MPPAKAKANQDDAKSDTASLKERNGQKESHKSNGKLQRVASSTGSQLKDATSARGSTNTSTAPVSQPPAAPGVSGHDDADDDDDDVACTLCSYLEHISVRLALTISLQLQWSTFDRDVLHDYRREHRLDTPTAFSSSYRYWVLSQSYVGLQSPTMARRAQFRRQSKDDLAKAVRRHFNGAGIQENDVIVDFLHKVRNPGVVKPRRNKELPHSSPLP